MSPEAEPVRSPQCLAEEHGACGHVVSSGMALFPRRFGGGAWDSLCNCDCHRQCPLAGKAQVRPEEWERLCACPGADTRKEARARLAATSEERKARMRHVMAEVEVGHGRSKEDIKRDLDAALARHDLQQPERMLDVMAEALWASSGPRALALPRLGRLGGRSIVQGLRWLRQYELPRDQDDDS